MSEIKLLIADNDRTLRRALKTGAAAQDYLADEAEDGIAALKLFKRVEYQLIILEPELPELDGISVIRQIRKISDIPIIVISSRREERAKLDCFEAGADDYVVKPLSLPELMARVRVFLRRSAGVCATGKKISFGGFYIDSESRSVYVDEERAQLTPKEYELLYYLTKNPNKAFSRDALLNEVWGADYIGLDRTVDTHIKKLRDVLKPYDGCIETVWGFGYKFVL